MEQEKKLKFSAVQMCSKIGDKKANYEKVSRLISEGLCERTDVLILPEVWTSGWSCSDFESCADSADNSETIQFLSDTAKKLNSWVIGGSYIQKTSDGSYLNRCPVISRNGKLTACYDKTHLFSYYGCDEGKYITKGKEPVMVNIEGINAGLTICYDIRFPEIYRAYRKAGADIFINCAAWGSKKAIPWEVMTKSRAVENQTYMIALTQSGHIKDDEFNLGHSRIIDYNGNVISEITEGEGIISAEISFNKMYDFRKKCTILDDIKEDYEVKIL